MKRTLPFLCGCLLATFATAETMPIPNGSFENWDVSETYYPDYYPFNSNKEEDRNITPNVTKTTDAHGGNFAVKLVTTKRVESEDSIRFGYFLNANPNDGSPDQWKGGIPYNEKPTGIQGYYKYNQATGDSGLIIISFRKEGSCIGYYSYSLNGKHSEYTPFQFTFTPALPETPDSMILGFASSYAIEDIALIGSELYIDDVSLTGVSNQPSQLNGGFESWASVSIDQLQDWYAYDDNEGSLNKTTDATDGNYAVELHTYLDNHDETPEARPTLVSNAYWNDNAERWIGGTPFTYTRDTLSFNYKYAPAHPTDSALITLSFQKEGTSIWFEQKRLGAAESYTSAELPFRINNFITPDTVIITLLSSSWENSLAIYAGSVLKVDNLHFKATCQETNISTTNNADDIVIYPNPATTYFTVNAQEKAIQRLVLTDLSGKEMLSLGKEALISGSIGLSGCAPGVYCVKISVGDSVIVKKLIVTE